VHQPQAQLVQHGAPLDEQLPEGPYDRLFPDERAAARARLEERRAERRERVPEEQRTDLLRFIEHHARELEDWQRDVISILRTEQAYFLPQMRTKIANEGLAVLCHQEIVQRLFLPAADYWEYEQLNASVVQPQPLDVNPYNLGVTILREIMRIAADPDDEERERWPWAGEADPFEQVREVCRTHDDESLLREFLSPGVCEQARLFAYEHIQRDPRRIRISSREAEVIREALIRQHSRFGIPYVEVVDDDYGGRGELLLEHQEEPGLDPEYARGTLTKMAHVWGRRVVARTVRDGKPKWYAGDPDGTSGEYAGPP